MLYPHRTNIKSSPAPLYTATDDPVGPIPDFRPVMHDHERSPGRQHRQRPKKLPEPPVVPTEPQELPESDHRVDDYA